MSIAVFEHTTSLGIRSPTSEIQPPSVGNTAAVQKHTGTLHSSFGENEEDNIQMRLQEGFRQAGDNYPNRSNQDDKADFLSLTRRGMGSSMTTNSL